MEAHAVESKSKEKSNHSAKPASKRFWRMTKRVAIAALCVIGACTILNWMWVASGSNKWELIKEGQGIKLYSLKAPGSSLVRIKATMVYKGFTLSHFVAAMIDDNNTENCQDWIPGCLAMHQIEKFSPETMSDSWLAEMEMPWPLKKREFLYKSHLTQNKETKEIFIELIAAPTKIPTREDYVRLDRIHNTWRYTPQPNGDVLIDHSQYAGFNGMFPDFLFSLSMKYGTFDFLANHLPGLLDKDEYRNARFDYIQEPDWKPAPEAQPMQDAKPLSDAKPSSGAKPVAIASPEGKTL